MRTTPFKRTFLCLLFLLSVIHAVDAHAAITSTGMLDTVLNNYSAAASAWAATIKARATFLFWSLATISMVWTAGMMVLRKADIAEFYGEFIKFIMFTGFFWWLLSNGPTMAIGIIHSMESVGSTASGFPSALSPSGIVDIGFSIFFTVIDKTTVWAPLDSAVGVTISGIILVCMALIAINMLLLLISGWILAYAGVFYLGFGGSRWTSDMAIAYFKTVLSIAIQTMTMILLVGIGKTFVNTYYTSMSSNMNLKEMGVMLIVAVVLLVLTNKVPPMLGGVAMGGGAGAIGNGFGAGAAMAASAVAGSMLAAGGAAMAAAGANAVGGAQALTAAFKKASADVSGGGSSESSGGSPDFNSGDGGSSSSSQQTATSPESTPLGKAMGLSSSSGGSSSSSNGGSGGGSSSTTSGGGRGGDSSGSEIGNAAKITAGTVSNLASGVGQVAKEKFQNFKDSMQNRIDQTLPGQVATAIRNDMPSFSDNSLSGDNSHDPAAEVAAFVNRSEQV
ncbi:P-type conjugative transfer protein TrbL [Methylomonas sp. AM2-LC]|uniref:P-type conjugative transfer protein TrbL n=1 Tax=Methylomonas sp. AM2-LC TaxID=3153301 RepID=UPI003266E7F4